MAAKRSATKKSTGRPAKKATKKAARKPAPAMKRAAAARPATKAVRKTTKQVARKAPSGIAEKTGRAPAKAVATRNQPAIVPGTDPKAEHAREHMNKMKGIDSQRVEEHHRMTRHKKNQ